MAEPYIVGKAMLVSGRIGCALLAAGFKYYRSIGSDGQQDLGKLADTLADLGLNIGAGVATQPLDQLLSHKPQAVHDFGNHHFVNYSGQVLRDLVLLFATRRHSTAPQRKRAEEDRTLRELAKKIPTAWEEYLKRSTRSAHALSRDEFLHLLRGSFKARAVVPAIPAEEFVSFLRTVHPLDVALRHDLAGWLSKQIRSALAEGIVSDHPSAEKALRKALLHFHTQHRDELVALRRDVKKARRTLVRVEQKVKKVGKDVSETLSLVKGSGASPLGLYFQALQQEYKFIEPLGMPLPKEKKQREEFTSKGITVREAYVEPPCSEEHHEAPEFDRLIESGKQPFEAFMPRLAEHKRIVLLGDPGMGKSTLIRHLIHGMASGRPPAQAAAALKGYVPFPFIMRDLVPHMFDLEPDSKQWRWATLLDAFKSWCPAKNKPELIQAFLGSDSCRAQLDELLSCPRAFFLIDGLDEVGGVELREDIQKVIFEGYGICDEEARFLITSRVIGYWAAAVHDERVTREEKQAMRRVLEHYTPEEAEKKPERGWGRSFRMPDGSNVWLADVRIVGLRTIRDYKSAVWSRAELLYLTPFAAGHMQQFAAYWFGKRFNPGNAAESTADFLEAIRRHESVRIIGRCPYVLLLLALVYQRDRQLPDGRADVYARIAEIYLITIDDKANITPRQRAIAARDAKDKFRWLQLIAIHMQMRRVADAHQEEDSDGERGHQTHTATGQDIADWLQDELSAEEAHEFVLYLGERTGLLLPRANDHFEWMHNSFMEFFAALYLAHELKQGEDLLVAKGRAERRGPHFDEAGYRKKLPFGPIPVTPADLSRWAGDERWHEVLIFLLERQGGGSSHEQIEKNPEQVKRYLEDLFPELDPERPANALLAPVAGSLRDSSPSPGAETDASRSDAATPLRPLLPLPAVELAVKLAHDHDLALPASTRQHWWRTLWSAYLAWPHSPWVAEVSWRWPIAPILLDRSEHRAEILGALSSVLPQYPGEPLFLYQCDKLTTADLSYLTGLDKLRYLNLSGCTGLHSTQGLRSLPVLKALDMGGCTGLEGDEALQGLTGLDKLEALYLTGCTGLRSTEGLGSLPALKALDLRSCTGLEGDEALQGLIGLDTLGVLYLNRCTRLNAKTIAAFELAVWKRRGPLGRKLHIDWP